MNNRFHVLRHGQSEANVRSLIVSSPEIGIDQYGLTDHGRNQVIATLESHRDTLQDVDLIFASDFRRARETAEIVGNALGLEVHLATELRERFFGDWDGQSSQHYQSVWDADAVDPGHQQSGVESVRSVVERTTALVNRIDTQYSGKRVLLVSHGDPLQILLTAVAGSDLRTHRQLTPLQTAEFRPLARR